MTPTTSTAAPHPDASREPAGGGPKRRIYVASSWRNAHQPEVVARLRAAGHEVYDFRHPDTDDPLMRLTPDDREHFDWHTTDPRLFADKVGVNPLALGKFAHDKGALEWCDTCVLVLPCGRSAHIEAGYAAGQGKTVLFLLHEDRFEPELMYLLGSGFACSLDELIAHSALARALPSPGPSGANGAAAGGGA